MTPDTQTTPPKTFRMNGTLFAIYVVTLVVIAVLSAFTEIFIFVLAISLFVIAILTLKYFFTTVTAGPVDVEYRTGWLNTTNKHIPYDNINTVDVVISLAGKMLDFGTIKIFTGNDVEGIRFDNVDHPNELKDLIDVKIDKPVPEQAPAAQQTVDPADEIAKLDKLRDDGTITNEEFEAKKKQLLGL